MPNPLADLSRELAAAVEATGLQARTGFDPDRGPGTVIGPPRLDWPDDGRVGCGVMRTADVEVEVTVIGAGYAPEQVEQLYEDASTVWQALVAAGRWRVTSVIGGATTDSPAYTITVNQ